MEDFITVLQIFLKYQSSTTGKYAPFHCEHDVIYIFPGVSADVMDKDDVQALDDLGVFPESEHNETNGWMSYRFGSC